MSVQVMTYEPRFAADFAALNYQWIEQYFAVEDEDRAALDHPQAYAIDSGGEIFFVLDNDQVVGTAAMVPYKGACETDGVVFELAKMAVSPDAQGKGHSHLLMQACLEFAHTRQASEVVLLTNDILAPALGLYTGAGFVAVPQITDERYARGNLEMRLTLRD